MLADYAGVSAEQLARATQKPTIGELLVRIIPRNPFKAMADTEFLQIIFFALLFGIALTILSEQRRKPVVDFLETVNDAMIVLVKLVMRSRPSACSPSSPPSPHSSGTGAGHAAQVRPGDDRDLVLFTVTFYPATLHFAGMSPAYFFSTSTR